VAYFVTIKEEQVQQECLYI